jgi:hypothetical protein
MSLTVVGSQASGGGSRKKIIIVVAVAAALVLVMLLLAAVGGYVYYTKYRKNATEESFVDYPTDGLMVINVTTSVPTTVTPTTSVLSTVSTVLSTSIPTSIPTTTMRATCYDGIQNQGEVSVDCGGPCLPCVKTAADVAACFNSKGMKLYTRSGYCPKCTPIKTFFGSAYSSLDIRDCEDEDEREQCLEELADDYGVDEEELGFPTWILYGIPYPGASVKKMQAETGCE